MALSCTYNPHKKLFLYFLLSLPLSLGVLSTIKEEKNNNDRYARRNNSKSIKFSLNKRSTLETRTLQGLAMGHVNSAIKSRQRNYYIILILAIGARENGGGVSIFVFRFTYNIVICILFLHCGAWPLNRSECSCDGSSVCDLHEFPCCCCCCCCCYLVGFYSRLVAFGATNRRSIIIKLHRINVLK